MAKFNRQEHVYTSPDFEEIVKDTIRFFNGTPVYAVPAPERFYGTGVYAIYCVAKSGVYKDFHEINRTSFDVPIYVGKAVPTGWRQGRIGNSDSMCYELYNRIREHGRSIESGDALQISDFHCRFMILESKETDLIGTVEAALIRKYQPIWNTLLDGFGNHDPGSGRYQQAKSDWDVCHPGRAWAEKCQGKPTPKNSLLASIRQFMENARKS
ncbi:MAG: Eco29kI family restriction endonuclease [Akkermansiaceae bacterium]|nr:Eco29kI family restriction endonuclease [Akkermansiaceae bacterium]